MNIESACIINYMERDFKMKCVYEFEVNDNFEFGNCYYQGKIIIINVNI